MIYFIVTSMILQEIHKSPGILTTSMDLAVEQAIKENILADFLKRHRGEVNDLILEEFNLDFHVKSEKEISRAEGFQLGKNEGLQLGRNEGLRLGKERVLRNLFSMGFSPEESSSIVSMDIAQVQLLFDSWKVK